MCYAMQNLFPNSDRIVTKKLPDVNKIYEKISCILKNNFRHRYNYLEIDLGYICGNLGYWTHDKKRQDMDNNIFNFIQTHFDCRFQLSSNRKYERILHISAYCYCSKCMYGPKLCVTIYKECISNKACLFRDIFQKYLHSDIRELFLQLLLKINHWNNYT